MGACIARDGTGGLGGSAAGGRTDTPETGGGSRVISVRDVAAFLGSRFYSLGTC